MTENETSRPTPAPAARPRTTAAVLAVLAGVPLLAGLPLPGALPLGHAAPAAARAPAPPGPTTPSSDDPFVRRAEIERRRTELAEAMGALAVTDAELQAILVELDRQVRAQTAVVDAARAALLAAGQAADRAAQAEAAKAAEVADLEERMRQMAVDTYVSPPSEQRLSVVLRGGDLNDLNRAMVFFDAKFSFDGRIVDELERARQQLTVKRRQAREALTAAAARSDEVAAALTELEAVRTSQQDLIAALHLEMNVVGGEDAALAGEAEAIDTALAQRRAELMAAATRRSGRGALPLVVVRGIEIHASIAPNLEAMLAAAEADGIVLTGGGFRSHEAQIATRRANCGEDDYSVWEKPASQCSPPTARPGTSQHEVGLAVDFTYQGAIISSRTSPAFVWLAQHAAAYGFANLPSEPWHWSTTGG